MLFFKKGNELENLLVFINSIELCVNDMATRHGIYFLC